MSEFPSSVPPAAPRWPTSSSEAVGPDGPPRAAQATWTPQGPSTPPGSPPPPPAPPDSAADHAGTEGPAGLGRLRNVIEWVVIIAVALIGAVLMRTFLIQAFFIPSESMVPTLVKGDRVLVNKLSYHLHPVHRGDIVVFTRTPGKIDPAFKDLIKRVVGLPGEQVSGHDGHVYINGHKLVEPYLPADTVTSSFSPLLIPANMYWVMGDNRANSSDSRVFGAIAKHQIVGRAFVLWWPLNRVRLL